MSGVSKTLPDKLKKYKKGTVALHRQGGHSRKNKHKTLHIAVDVTKNNIMVVLHVQLARGSLILALKPGMSICAIIGLRENPKTSVIMFYTSTKDAGKKRKIASVKNLSRK